MSANWLQTYLEKAVERKLCTRIYCTTCGAMDFRRGVLRALGRHTGHPPLEYFDLVCALEIANALAGVTPPSDDASEFEAAARCLLFDLWSSNQAIEARLSGSWAGGVLARMQGHQAATIAARRAREEFERGAPGRREEERRLRQERHQARLVLKKERDRLWRKT